MTHDVFVGRPYVSVLPFLDGENVWSGANCQWTRRPSFRRRCIRGPRGPRIGGIRDPGGPRSTNRPTGHRPQGSCRIASTHRERRDCHHRRLFARGAVRTRSGVRGRPWMPVKRAGSWVWIGPIVDPPMRPRRECVVSSLRVNRPAHAWLEDESRRVERDLRVPLRTLPRTGRGAMDGDSSLEVLDDVAASVPADSRHGHRFSHAHTVISRRRRAAALPARRRIVNSTIRVQPHWSSRAVDPRRRPAFGVDIVTTSAQ